MKKSTKSASKTSNKNTEKNGFTPKKTKCPVRRKQFREKAPARLDLAEFFEGMTAERREFKTGSLGFFFGDKVKLMIDGEECKCQVGLNITLVGSKELAHDEEDTGKDNDENEEEESEEDE